MAKRKPLVSNLEFQASFPVMGKVMQLVSCSCEEEGDVGLRVPRDPEADAYDKEDPGTYFDLYGFCEGDAYKTLRVGDWVEAMVTCTGYLKRVRSREISMEGDSLAPGTMKYGKVRVDDGELSVDFGLFLADLRFEDAEQREKAAKAHGLREGTTVATDCDVDLKVTKVADRRRRSKKKRGRTSWEAAYG